MVFNKIIKSIVLFLIVLLSTAWGVKNTNTTGILCSNAVNKCITQFPVIVKGTATAPVVEIFDYSGPVGVKKGEISWTWTDKGIWLTGTVIDKKIIMSPMPPAEYANGYKYDSVEFWIGERQYCAGFTKYGPALWSFFNKSISPTGTIQMKRDTRGYVFTISVSWKELGIIPKEGTRLKLAVGINDHNSVGDVGTQSYMPIDWVWGDTSTFADCVLTKTTKTSTVSDKFAKTEVSIEYPSATDMEKITVTINETVKIGDVNRDIYGVCAHAPPWSDFLIDAVKPFLKSSSIRVWVRTDPKWNAKWGNLVLRLQPSWVLGFTDNAWHPEQVKYISSQENNLFDYQQPAALLNCLRYAIKTTKTSLSAFEIWNEPEFKVNGTWPAKDMARYVSDCSIEIKKEFPKMEVGAFLCDKTWNADFLRAIPDNVIDFVDHHYYNTFWFHVGSKGKAAYTGKVIYTPLLKLRIESDLNDIVASGKSLKLISSEWGVHPKTYKAPYGICHDMGAVIYNASAVLAFMDKDLAAAQYFKISSSNERPLDHFRLINPDFPKDGIGNLRLFQYFGQWFKGRRLRTAVKSPLFSVSGLSTKKYPERVSAPVVECAAALWNNSSTICVVLINKHFDQPADIRLSGLSSEWQFEKGVVIHSESMDSTNVKTDPLISEDNLYHWKLPPRSIIFSLLKRKTATNDK